ncbi:hypothetical protein [Acinetobacter nosocomialis]|uniref:hypothetical protein n=1 Tax=Acinetobacter nosocomialis TaxID=106654 RepID=UPI00148E97B5|nr:hypothetical protein [Acinetobacter nosocomialis]
MNYQILAETELNRKISLFQQAVEAYVLHPSLITAAAVAKTKADLGNFALWGV